MNEDLVEKAFIAYFGFAYLAFLSAVLLLTPGKKRMLKIAGVASLVLAGFLIVRYDYLLEFLFRHGLFDYLP